MLGLLFPPAFFPFTYPWFIKKQIHTETSILDVGCGDGEFMAHLVRNKIGIKLYGIELFDPYITKAKRTKAYKKIIKIDVRKIKIPMKSFDIVLASQVVEHLKKSEAFTLINKMEKIAGKKVIIGTPNGYFTRGGLDDNKLQKHNSYWYINDFNRLGYKVYGQSLKFIYGKKGLINSPIGRLPLVRLTLFIISYLLSPIVYFFPQYSAHLIAVKDISK